MRTGTRTAPRQQVAASPGSYLHALDEPLLQFSKRDAWRVRDAFEGVQVMGSIGSGKTSGSGRAIAKSFLEAGFGGLVLCAKTDERALWERYAKETGREKSLIIIDGAAGSPRRMNFLDYEMRRPGAGSGVTFNVVALLEHVLNTAGGGTGQEGGENGFWRDTLKETLSHTIDPLWWAYGRIRLTEIMQMIYTRPHSPAQAADVAWRDGSFCMQTLQKAWQNPAMPRSEADYHVTFDYWTKVFANPDARTSGNIVATISSRLAPLLKGKLAELFCGATSVVPELTHEGAILVVDLSVKEWGEAGVLAQQIMKFQWQQATERRAVTATTRPVFLWADECQFFVSEYDAKFQSTARSQRAATVYLTQNLPTYYSRIGGRHPEHAADSLLGNFVTKIFHAQSDPKTNQYAADLIGKSVQRRYGRSMSRSDGVNVGRSWQSGGSHDGKGGHSSSYGGGGSQGASLTDTEGESWSEVLDYPLQPGHFTTLAKGGPEHGYQVGAVVFQGGRKWAHSGTTWLPCAFSQR